MTVLKTVIVELLIAAGKKLIDLVDDIRKEKKT